MSVVFGTDQHRFATNCQREPSTSTKPGLPCGRLKVQMSVGLPVSKVSRAATDHVSGDAVSALLTLGYKRGEAEKAVQQVRADASDTVTVEVVLKDALKQLGR